MTTAGPDWQLRYASRDDLERLHALFCVPEVFRYLADGAPPPRSVAEAWIAGSEKDRAGDGPGLWLLENGERELAGCVRLELLEDGRSAELTYLLHPQYWGQGLATRMSWTVMQRAFGSGRVDAVVAGTDEPNTASVAVLRRLGMTFRRAVQYPAGPGVEYACRSGDPGPLQAPIEIPVSE